jgi:uncharacterized protein YbjT (DUF2867 family)
MMRIVVVGGTGLVGTRLVTRLRELGHDPVAASRATGVDALTGHGLEVVRDADAVVDVLNPPPDQFSRATEFFTTSTRNLLAAERAAATGHHILLSIVNLESTPDFDYYQAKIAQEQLISAGGVPFSILRATQFFEFIEDFAALVGVDGGATLRLPRTPMRPIAVDDVVTALVDVATGAPTGGRTDLAGPEPFSLDVLAARVLAAHGDTRQVVATEENELGSLAPTGAFLSGRTRLEEWLASV